MYNSNESTLQMNRFNIENGIYYLHTPLYTMCTIQSIDSYTH